MIRFKGVLLALVAFGLMAGWAQAGDVEEEIDRILAKYEKRFEKFKKDLRRELMDALQGRKAVRPTPTPTGGKPYLGVDVKPVSEGLRVLLNLGKGEGLVVTRVVEGGPCNRAGVKEYDIILSFDGKKVGSKDALREILSELRGGQRVNLRVLRDGERITLRLTLGSRGGAAPPPREGVEEFVDETLRGDRAKIRRNLKNLIEGDVTARMRARRFFENLLSKAGPNRKKLYDEIERTAEELMGRLSPADRDEMRKMFRKMLGGFERVVKRGGRESQTKEDIEKFLEEMLGGGRKKEEPAKDDIDKLLDELLGKEGKKSGKKKPGPKKTEEDEDLPVTIPPKWDKAMEDILGKDGWDRLKKMMKDPQYKEMLKQFFPEGFEFTPANVRKLLDQYGIDLESLPDRLREMGVEEEAIERIMKLLESEGEPEPATKTKGWMGIRAKDAPEGGGVIVTKVEPGGPGVSAGLKEGDVILKIGRKRVRTRADLKDSLKGKYAGDTLRLTVERSSMTIKIDLVLGKK
ncbi:MAG: PDZ domain-containing protein [Planctomycetota bacterium]|jgi:membrane-associated protease RseP (regulator of RpoE activity)